MSDHPDDRALQRHLDGDLAPAECWRIEGHLQGCHRCRHRYEALETLVGEVESLAASVDPPYDLWPGIAGRIRASGRGVARLGWAAPHGRNRALRVGWSGLVAAAGTRRRARALGWIAAVAAALVLGIGLGRYLPRSALPTASLPIESVPTEAAPADFGPGAALARYDEVAYDAAIADLQIVLESMRGDLQSETVAAIEANLRIIDGAIADARAALAADPANEHLHRHLAANMQTKLQLLRMVTGAGTAHS